MGTGIPALTQSLIENARCAAGAEAGGTQRIASPRFTRRWASNRIKARGLV